jgi:hypothetical protein
VPDTVGVTDSVAGTACEQTVTLDGGRSVEIVGGDPRCAGAPATPVLFFDSGGEFGSLSSMLTFDKGDPPLVLSGLDGSTRWVGLVGQVTATRCFKIRFTLPDTGAWLESGRVHLTAGVVLDLAPEFQKPTYPPDAFPLRRDDELCLDAQGRVASVSVCSLPRSAAPGQSSRAQPMRLPALGFASPGRGPRVRRRSRRRRGGNERIGRFARHLVHGAME